MLSVVFAFRLYLLLVNAYFFFSGKYCEFNANLTLFLCTYYCRSFCNYDGSYSIIVFIRRVLFPTENYNILNNCLHVFSIRSKCFGAVFHLDHAKI